MDVLCILDQTGWVAIVNFAVGWWGMHWYSIEKNFPQIFPTVSLFFSSDGIFVNQRMIENGFAYEYTYETSYRYQKEFKLSEAKARNEGTGLWSEDACSK